MNIKKYLILIVALFFTGVTGLRAQYNPYWQWGKADTVNTSPISNSGSVLAVKGGKVLWGRMTAVKHFTGGEPHGNYTLEEYDSFGVRGNVTLINGKVQLFDAHADAAGNWYVLGRYYDTLLFSGGARYVRPNPPSNPDADHFMVKFMANSMAIAWMKPVGPFTTVSSRSFTMDNSQIYIVADSLNHTVVRTMSLTNGLETSRITQDGLSRSTSIQVDAQGNVYLAGICAAGGMNFNGTTEPANPPNSYSYIVKYRSNGAHAWHYWMNDNYCLTRKLTLYQNRFLYYTGNHIDSFFIGTRKIETTLGSSDYVAARLDTSGTIVWTRQLFPSAGSIGFADAYHAVVTPDTALVMFAQGNGYIYWGDSLESNLQGVTAATLVSIGPNNKMRWERPLYTQYTTNQRVVTEGLGVWVTGNAFSQTAYVQLDTMRLRVPARKFTPYLAKMKLVRPIPVNPPASVAGNMEDEVSVFPIPVRTTLKVAGLDGATVLSISDISGRVVRTVRTDAGTRETLIDVADLPRGAYTLDMRGTGVRTVRKIVLH